MHSDAQRVADLAAKDLSIANATLSQSYYYHSLVFCVVDCIFSLGVRYQQVEKVVQRLAGQTKWPLFRPHGLGFPPASSQAGISDLVQLLRASQSRSGLFNNRCYANPSSSRNKVLKADLVLQFAEILAAEKIEVFQDLAKHQNLNQLDQRLCALPALKSGVAVRYFHMLAGDEDQVKPDRMIHRFLETALLRKSTNEEAVRLVQDAVRLLKPIQPKLTARMLDHEIWKRMRRR